MIKTISPVDGSTYVERSYATSEEIKAALVRAKQAQKQWRQLSVGQRMAYCSKAIEALVTKKAELANELCWQMGRPIRYAAGEIDGLKERADYMINIAEAALKPVVVEKKSGFNRYIKREPLGVVFIIAPWNYPYLTAVNSIIPALLAGNSVIIKHSAQTPLCAEQFAEAFKSAGLPLGIFQFLHLSHQDTEKVIQSSQIDYVAFTGSVKGGVMVEHAIAGRFISASLELGGKDSAYVRHDANLDETVATIIDGAYFNSGQSCCGIERIYVHSDVYHAFVEKAVDLVNQYQLGDPTDTKTTLGPLVNTAAASFVRAQIDEAIAQGAQAHIDVSHFTANIKDTAYLAPQVLTNVNHNMRIMSEESFGPVVGIMKVASDAEAISLMNDSEFGLTAAVFTQDEQAAIAIGEKVECGTWFMNRCDYLDPALAWSGVKNSGNGCSLSVLAFEKLTRPKSFHLRQPV